MKKLKILCTLLLTVMVLSACSAPKVEKASTHQADWLLIKEDIEKTEVASDISFLDKNGETLYSEDIVTGKDTTYKYYDEENGVYYRYGPGGLISIELKNKKVNYIIDDKDINGLRVSDTKTYYYENIGPDGNDYRINICDISNTSSCLKLTYFVNDFIVNKGNIYTVNGKTTTNDEVIVRVYNHQKVIKELPVEDSGSFYLLDGSVYYLTNHGMLNIDTKEFISFVDQEKKLMQLANTFDAFYSSDSKIYLISNELGSIQMYSAKRTHTTFELSPIKLDSSNVIDYEFDGKNTFTFMDKQSKFYSYDTNTGKQKH